MTTGGGVGGTTFSTGGGGEDSTGAGFFAVSTPNGSASSSSPKGVGDASTTFVVFVNVFSRIGGGETTGVDGVSPNGFSSSSSSPSETSTVGGEMAEANIESSAFVVSSSRRSGGVCWVSSSDMLGRSRFDLKRQIQREVNEIFFVSSSSSLNLWFFFSWMLLLVVHRERRKKKISTVTFEQKTQKEEEWMFWCRDKSMKNREICITNIDD